MVPSIYSDNFSGKFQMSTKGILHICLYFFYSLLNICYAQGPKLMLPIGHTIYLWSAQFSPDAKKIITASNDRTAKIWDVASGNLIADLKGSRNGIWSVQFSPDGKKIVSASWDSTAKIWDAASGNLIADLSGHVNDVTYARFSPDGKKIVTASQDSTAKIWDVATGNLIADLKGHRGFVRSAQFSPDGKKIVSTSQDSTTKIWDAASGNLIADLHGHTNVVNSAQFSPDGKKIVTASFDSNAKIWDAVTGRLIIVLEGHSNEISFVQFSPDGKKVVTASWDSTAKIWDAASGNLIVDLKGHTNWIRSARFSPDGKKIVTASYDGTAKIWDVATGNLIADLKGHRGSVLSAQFSPACPNDPSGGKKIVTAFSNGTAKIWDATSGNLIADLKGHTQSVSSVQFSPNGKKVVTASNSAKIWDVASGKIIADLKEHTRWVYSAQFSSDGNKIVTASQDSTAKIWDVASGHLITDLKGHTGFVYSAWFSPDGKKVVTASKDNTAKIWDAASGNLIADLKGHRREVRSAQFSPDGKKVVTASWDSTAKIWDTESGNVIADFKGHKHVVSDAQFSRDGETIVTISWDHTSKIWEVASGKWIADIDVFFQFSPDGKKFLTTSQNNTVNIWDVVSNKVIVILKGHTQNVMSAQFSPDGKKIVTASYDHTAKIWDVATGNLIADLKGHTNWVTSTQFSPDGNTILTNSPDNTLKIWDAGNGKVLYTFFAVDSTDYLIVDALNRYDGTEAARKLLYFTCGTEVIELNQVKDQLWIPNLAERIMKGETINAKSLEELNICGLTPEVEDASSKADEYYFKITPRRGGLGETILSVNGNPTKTYKPGQLKKNGGNYELIIKKNELNNYFIAGADNQVTLKAYTSDNAISSRGLKITEDKTKQNTTPPNLYAVMVGVSDYKGDELDLKYAAKDATDISNAVSNAARKLLNSDDKEHVFMYNLTTAKEHYQLPEKNSIKKILEEIGKKATANDILLIFFAGHGVMTGDGDKKQFYFLTADASSLSSTDAVKDVGISTTELNEWMKPQNIKAQKRILIFDACNSGQAINDLAGKDFAVRNDDKAQQIKAIDKLNEKSGLFILAASASNQSAYEMGRYSQGLLTYSLLKAIKQQPDILNGGKYLDVSRWFNAAKESVIDLSKENGARQEPQIVTNTNFNIGVVDGEVMGKIVLPQEKPLFAASNFQNADENVMADDLGLNKLTDQQLNDISSRGAEASISYMGGSSLPDAYTLTGRYTVAGNTVSIKAIIRKNNEIKHRLELTGTKDKLNDLAKTIVVQATEWVARNK